jgi:ribosomal protein L18E
MAKIEEAGGKAMSLVEAAKKHPKGSKLRLIG